MKADGYIHIRENDVHGKKPTGGATVGWYRDHENDQIIITIAKCHKDDLYNKRAGREIVNDRLELYKNLPVDQKKNIAELFTVAYTLADIRNGFSMQMREHLEVDLITKMAESIQVKDITNKEIINFAEYYIHSNDMV